MLQKRKFVIWTVGLIFLVVAWLLVGPRPLQGPETYRVTTGAIEQIVATQGKVAPYREAALAVKMLGKVEQVWVEEGDRVQQGDVLVSLESTEFTARFAQAEERRKERSRALARSEQLFAEGVVSQAVYEGVRADQKIAAARAQELKELLDAAELRAPFSGKLIWRDVDPGETVQPGVPILALADDRVVQVHAEVEESDVGPVRLGQRVTITADGYPGQEFLGEVTHIAPRVGTKTVRSDNPADLSDAKVLIVKIDLDPVGGKLKFGMTVDVEMRVSRKAQVLRIPHSAVVRDRGRTYVNVRTAEGIFVPRQVVLGLSDDWYVEVVEGLSAGDIIRQHVNAL